MKKKKKEGGKEWFSGRLLKFKLLKSDNFLKKIVS